MRVAEWQGWVALASLVCAFLALGWWLFRSPVTLVPTPPGTVRSAARTRHVVAVLVLASGALLTFGARWDELWHRMYGGFGDDFLWPPHMLMYVGLGLNVAFAIVGLAIASGVRAPMSGAPAFPGIRARFRAEPAIGLLGLTAAYQIASIPVDLVWHEIIGPDLTAWSLPHVLLAATTAGVLIAGVALSRARVAELRWRSDLLTVGILATSLLALLQVGTTEWDWAAPSEARSGVLAGRPLWAYPAVTVAVGVFHGVLARTVTGRVGAASVVAALALVVQAGTLVVGRLAAPPGPGLETAMAVAFGTVVMDLWWRYRRRLDGASFSTWARPGIGIGDAWVGTLAWLAGFATFGLAPMARRSGLSGAEVGDWVAVVVATAVAGMIAATVAAWLGPWLAVAGLGIARPLTPVARVVPATDPRTPRRGGRRSRTSAPRRT